MGTKDMNAGRPTVFQRLLFICVALVLVPASLYGSLAIKARFSDGPSVIFSGGPLVAGELVTGTEPDWSFVRGIREFELQLLNPANSRTLWIVEVENKLYLNSNYMGGLRQRFWKRWPAQAEQDGRAMIRIDGKRYERSLVRIKEGSIVERVAQAFSEKYPVEMTAAEVESETLWLFELAPRDQITNGGSR
jgi:hypothetical protein